MVMHRRRASRTHAADRVELKQPGKRWHADRGDQSRPAAWVPLRCLRPARARRRYRRLALPRPVHRRCRCCGRGRIGGSATMHRLQPMPLAPRLAPRWRTAFAARVWFTVLPGEQESACASARRYISLSDCLRAVPQSNNLSLEYRYLAASFASRPRLERGTYCLGGTFETPLDDAGCGLTCCLTVAAVAACGLMSPRICGRWLPVRLPAISLAAAS